MTTTPTVSEVFSEMFSKVQAPVLPAAVARLLAEINSPDPDMNDLELIVSAEPQISARVLRTINSSQFALRVPVKTVRHAITLLGFNRIRSIVLSYAMLEAMPRPKSPFFRHEMFWTDTLLRALLARSLTRRTCRHDPEEAFTAMMLADVSVPVLLMCWEDRYQPILARWEGHPKELSHLERQAFGWDHARATAWVLRRWEFPEDLVQLVAHHNLEPEELHKLGLTDSLANQIATAALLPSSIKPLEGRCRKLVRVAHTSLGLPFDAWGGILREIRGWFEAVCDEFGLSGSYAVNVLATLDEVTGGGAFSSTEGPADG
ncbi:MAG TPA: HDOD domain-containing protein [Candidatus Krumholzibacteria bacterium]|nr:HDOD domain-containing protein [Candidatus Krumholzibacteria bacterium]HRX50003.1 HDOD domain-containing protein [Candidatus Krumholzibacteria bacterium]